MPSWTLVWKNVSGMSTHVTSRFLLESMTLVIKKYLVQAVGNGVSSLDLCTLIFLFSLLLRNVIYSKADHLYLRGCLLGFQRPNHDKIMNLLRFSHNYLHSLLFRYFDPSLHAKLGKGEVFSTMLGLCIACMKEAKGKYIWCICMYEYNERDRDVLDYDN